MNRRTALPILALALSAALAACGGPPTANPDAVRSTTTLEARIILAEPLARGHFDAESPRARKVDGQLTAMLGHPLAFYFDAAIVPKWEDDFEALSIAALEDVAQRLTVLAREEPAMFGWVAPQLARIEWDFDATKEWEESKLDAGTLRIVLTPKSNAVIGEHVLEYAIGRAYGTFLGAKYAGIDPTSLDRDQDEAYFEWLTDYGYGYEKDRSPPKGADEELDAPSAKQLLRALRYAEALRGKSRPVEPKVRDWLVDRAKYFDQVRGSAADAVAGAPPSHAFHLAEAAYTAWIMRTIDALPDRDQRTIFEEIAHARGREGAAGQTAYPGFDATGYALRTSDRWRRAGHPSTRDGDAKNRDRDELFADVIAPRDFPPDERTGCQRDDALLYRDATTDTKVRERLFADVLTRKDPAWEKTVLANLLGVEAKDAVFALWKRTESDDAAFRAALRVLAGQVDGCAFAEADVFDQIPRLWRAHPRSRGPLLFLLSRYSSERVGWDRFERLFDTKLSKADVTAYLDEEPDPFRHVHWMWPGFASNWSHADVFVPRLDAWLTDHVRQFDMWGGEVLTLAEDICTDKSPADSAKLHAWLTARVKAHPSEEQTLGQALEKSKPGGCAH